MTNKVRRCMMLLLALVMVLTMIPVHQVEAVAIKHGSCGSDVRRLQRNLIGLGYLEGEADGSFGSKTKAAVQDFQSDFGLDPDGSAGNITQSAVRNAVVRLQTELKKLGYAPGAADGHFGSKTRSALLEFQRDHGLSRTGVADEETWARINVLCGGMDCSVGVRKGSSGTAVRRLQLALIGLGYLSGSADGYYGPKTENAVRLYQKAYGLDTDGSAGRKTMTSLKNTVATLQSDLAGKGYDVGTVDGVYGKGTTAAVKDYQSDIGVSANGVAGPKTMTALYGYNLGGSDGEISQTYKIWIDSLYQTGDYRKVWFYDQGRDYRTVHSSGCGAVSLAMGLNALQDTDKYDGYDIMLWFVEQGDYYGKGTSQKAMMKYTRKVGLQTTYCDRSSKMIENLKNGGLAIALIRDITGEELFTYGASKGHYVLVSGYRVKDGVQQIFVNNPLSYKRSGWFDLEDLMANLIYDRDTDNKSIVLLYK